MQDVYKLVLMDIIGFFIILKLKKTLYNIASEEWYTQYLVMPLCLSVLEFHPFSFSFTV
jgi:hypothetical protein